MTKTKLSLHLLIYYPNENDIKLLLSFISQTFNALHLFSTY